jgi:hypothetical protein
MLRQGEELLSTAARNGGSVLVVGLTEDECEWSSGYATVYGSSCGFTLGLFLTNVDRRLGKPAVFVDEAGNRIALTPEQQRQLDADWETFLQINRSADEEGRILFRSDS